MKKIIALLVLAGTIAAPLAQAKEWKEITIAMDATYPPFESLTPDGQLVGFEVDLANAVCAEMKLKCNVINAGWDGLIPGLMAKKYDALISSMNITDERKKAVDFTDPYYRMQNRFVARKGANIQISKEGLKGKTIAVQNTRSEERRVGKECRL